MDNLHAYSPAIIARLEEQCGYLSQGGIFTTIGSSRLLLGERTPLRMSPAVFVQMPDAAMEGKASLNLEERQDWSLVMLVGRYKPNSKDEYTDVEIGEMIFAVIQALMPPWKPGDRHLFYYRDRSVLENPLGWVEVVLNFEIKATVPYPI